MTPPEATVPATKPTPTRALKVKRVKLDKLVLDDGNPRLHDERDLAATTASLKAHGQVDPLVVQAGTMRVVAGHGRIESMRRLGWTDAQIVEVECDDAEFRALSIRLNRTGELAGWNAGALDAALSELAEAGWGNLPDFGFDGSELEALVKGAGGAVDPGTRTVQFEVGGDAPPKADDPGIKYEEKFAVLVKCRDESHQREVYEKLIADGYDLKVLAL